MPENCLISDPSVDAKYACSGTSNVFTSLYIVPLSTVNVIVSAEELLLQFWFCLLYSHAVVHNNEPSSKSHKVANQHAHKSMALFN